MTRTFHKMHGLGNDFVIFDAREEPLVDRRAARPRHRRPQDGHRLRPADRARAVDGRRPQDADLEPRRDRGRELRQCLALRRRADPRQDASRPAAAWSTGDGARQRRRSVARRAAFRMGPGAGHLCDADQPDADGLGRACSIRSRSTSAIRTSSSSSTNADGIDLDELGPRIEHDPVFPERINVNVAEVASGRHPPADVGARRRADPRLRHRRLRHGRGGDPDQARAIAR